MGGFMDEAELIASIYAPLVYLASTDPWNPASVEWFVSHSSLYFESAKKGWLNKRGETSDILIEENADINTLHQQKYQFNNKEYTSYGESFKDRNSRWYLKIHSEEYYTGMSLEELRGGDIPVYVHYDKKENHIEIQYFYLYAFNGNIMDQVKGAGIHEGDWEHTSIRISLDILDIIQQYTASEFWVRDNLQVIRACIISIYYGRHGKEGKWYFEESSGIPGIDDGYELVQGSAHHVVYSSKGGHASYTTANERNRRYVPFGFPLRIIDDYTDNKGEVWETWRNIVVLNSQDETQSWIHFNGQWGSKPSNILAAAGPYGPLMKTYYFTGDSPPTATNSVYRHSIPHPCAPHLEHWSNFALRSFLCAIFIVIILAILYIFL